jgi:hypothetical protein
VRAEARKMERLRDYQQQAKECREAAARATSPEMRDHYLRIAETWEILAKQRGLQLNLADVLAEIGEPGNGTGGPGGG